MEITYVVTVEVSGDLLTESLGSIQTQVEKQIDQHPDLEVVLIQVED